MDSRSNTRQDLIAHFLASAGWAGAEVAWLGQDASTRRYARLTRGPDTALLMDAPRVEAAPCPPDADEATRNAMGWNAQSRLAASRVDAFVAVAEHLRTRGFSAPEIYAADAEAGLALVEDFGEAREFARLIERGEQDEIALYGEAGALLAHLHSQPAPTCLAEWPILDYDELALRVNADLFAEWLPQLEPRMVTSEAMLADWARARDGLIGQAMTFPRDFILRDFHAENLLWLPDRSGLARIGLLDFQDAINGWDGWSMAMLIQDARRTVSDEACEAAVAAYIAGTGKDRGAFEARLAVLGTLNALRIKGLFARLPIRDGKRRYLDFMPRLDSLLVDNLRHPACAHMAEFVRTYAAFIFEDTV
jgi:aminoglycoside/choline kinase family phosphotransferase